MPSNNMNLGVDYIFGLFDGKSGKLLNLGDIQSISMVAHKTDVKSMPYNSPPRYAHVPDGFSGTFEIVRTAPDMENLQISLNQQFNAGAVMQPGFIQETVNNPDGSVSKYTYTNVDFFMTNPGVVARDNVVRQTITWMASDKVQIA